MLTIDGTTGEGGGQILRSSLSLSLCLGRPFRIINIRAARSKPGLRPQHLAAVNAAAKVANAKVTGAELSSQELVFIPGRISPGDYHFDIGTAGSTTLVLQTVLPALLIADGPSHLKLEGGTHNPNAPSYDFLAKSFIPLINRMGATVTAQLERAGFYPKGGGVLEISIEPARQLQLQPLELLVRGEILRKNAVAMLAHLPQHIAQRELKVVRNSLGIGPDHLEIRYLSSAYGQGNAVCVYIESQNITEVFTAFGERGVRAEQVAGKVVRQARRYLGAVVPVGEQLADQLLLPMALAGGGSFVTLTPSLHTKTNAAVIEQFMDARIDYNELGKDRWRITIHGRE